MGGSESDESAKEAKSPPPPADTQDQSPPTSTAAVSAEQSGFQAYSPIPPHGFVAHPQAHPYMWGVQPMVPPYGAPPHPYVAMYPHGVYAHPSIPPGAYHFSPFAVPHQNGMTEASGNTTGNAEAESKPPEGKEKLPVKRSKGSLGNLKMITGKSDEEGKTTGPSANGASSKSGESASDGSSEGSDASSRRNSPSKSGGRQEESEADGPQNGGSSAHTMQNGMPNAPHTMPGHGLALMAIPAPGAGGPTTNLNIGMDYWGNPASSAVPAMQGKVPSATPLATGMVPAGSRDNLQSPLWLQDEKELKRQRRKQSNRESARRSRLRKQAEYDELAQRAEVLKEENATLRSELNHIRSEYEQLTAEHAALKKRIGEVPEGLTSSRAEQGMVTTDTQDS